jgi:hypothetical protein
MFIGRFEAAMFLFDFHMKNFPSKVFHFSAGSRIMGSTEWSFFSRGTVISPRCSCAHPPARAFDRLFSNESRRYE